MSNEPGTLSTPVDADLPTYRHFTDPLRRQLERVRAVLLYSSLYLVVIAMVEVATAMLALSLPLNPAPVVVGLVTFAVYVGDRISDVDSDEAVDPGKADKCAFVRRHRTVLSVLSAAAYGFAIAIAVLGGPLALAITLLPGAFWVLYATDWLPTLGSYFKRLKDVLVVNSFVVALAWAIAVVLLPIAFADAAVTPAAVVVFVYFLVDTFVNTEIPNVADMEGDAALGVSTFPVVFGVTRTRQILYGIDVALVAFVAGAYALGVVSTALTVAVLVGLGYALVLASRIGRTTHYRRLSVAGEAKHLLVIAVYLALL